MNQLQMRKSSLFAYQAVILDLDGTLYYQKPFRIRMLLYLMEHIIRHPSSMKDIFILKRYREIRERWELIDRKTAKSDEDLDSRQYAYVAKEKHVSPERVKHAVQFFMLEAPLTLLPQYKDMLLAQTIVKLRKEGIRVVVYSDYPVFDKLKALKIEADACFTSADKAINCMKPNPKGLSVILETLGIGAEDAVMIGDRYEKDGLAAEGNQMDYIIVSSSRKERQKLANVLGYTAKK